MKLHKFFGLTSRAVLNQVRAELGADAMIVGNRSVAEGIEITAMSGDAMDAVLDDAAGSGAAAGRGTGIEAAPPSAPQQRDTERWAPRRVDPSEVTWPLRAEAASPPPDLPRHATAALAAEPRFAARPDRDAGVVARLSDEVAALRGMLEGQLSRLAWNDTERRAPLRAQFTRDLLASGYSASLAREITARLPDDLSPGRARKWLAGVISNNLRCVDGDGDMVSRGGVYALVGPTGVGKTTTVAKLAARGAVRFGAAGVALLTTDTYRVGAHDQLRIYAKILGVAVHTVSSSEDLAQALESLAGRRLVLIDTVGMGQRDTRVSEQTALLSHPRVERVLVLNATAQAETLQEVVAAYGTVATNPGEGTGGAIVTKLDETARPGQVLDTVIRNRLVLQYVTNGQRVPEDLHAANASYLVHRSLRIAPAAPAASPFALSHDEYGFLMGAATGAAHA